MARKTIKKWNPDYSKTSVRTVLQNVLSKKSFGDISGGDKTFIKEVLKELDEIVIRKQNLKEE
tara:strand:+ start:439 stop:627 length:189 start_codon:yes stop_codon:yes gene_type:complete